MISPYIIIAILFIHWIADFVLQTEWQAQNKSKEWLPLLAHTSVYSLCWIPFILIVGNNDLLNNLLFVFITWVSHTITDYFTSRINAYLWRKQKVHDFFVSVGFDQFLHYTQLILTYYYLIQP